MAITTREELHMALTEASELEHGLACQYLFAAFSLKQGVAEGLTTAQMTAVNGWRAKLRRIAKEEMEHLATVTNLLSATGGAAHFRRPNFPQHPGFYPPDVAFALEPFSETALRRYIEFERNQAAPASFEAPVEVSYRHVGELYAQILSAFQTLDETTLFINAAQQDTELTSGPVHPDRADTRAQAVAALTSLMNEGEVYNPADPNDPCPTGAPWSHYCAFYTMLKEYHTLKAADPAFAPARAVIANPLTDPHRDAPDGTRLTNPDSRAVVKSFNGLYAAMILLFQQYYAFAGDNREELRSALLRFMQEVLWKMGVFATKLPATMPADATRAGASFEFYGQYRVTSTRAVAWAVILEKINAELADLTALAARNPPLLAGDTTLADAAGVVTEIRDALAAAVQPPLA